jgi:hypothetical protein
MVDEKALEILSNYQKDVERWKENGGHYKDIQPLSINDILFIRQVLHPTKKEQSKKVTEELIRFICDKGIVTAKEIYEATGLSDKPVLSRLKVFQQFGLVRRESKKYYLPTPRMLEIRNRYLKRICS